MKGKEEPMFMKFRRPVMKPCLILLIFFVLLPGVMGAQTMAGNVWDGSVAKSFAGGKGEALDPYLIENGAQLAKLATDVDKGNSYEGKFFQLAANIVLNQWALPGCKDCEAETVNYWLPIGSKDKPFKGNFDGQLHCVSGIDITRASEYQGLFGYMDSDGIIQNLGVVDSRVDNDCVEAIICDLNHHGSIINCYVTNCQGDKILKNE